jgi:RNA polymerase sigma-70 factor (ECF subfamily)
MGGKKATVRADDGPIESSSGPQPEKLGSLSSEELARRSGCGCRACFGELVSRHSARLYQFLQHRTSNAHDAEDLVQDTFVRAFENIGRYRSSYCFSTWLFAIARRLASSRLRSLRRSQSVVEMNSGVPEPGDLLAQQETRQSLWAAARGLPPNQYQVLRLRYAEDMSIKQITKVMGKSQVNVKVLLYRARVRLAERLRKTTTEGQTQERVSSKETLAFMKAEGA